MTTDLTYSCTDGIWTRFYPESDAGHDAFNVMAKADPQGVVAFMPAQVPSVLRQLRAAGLTVHKAKPVSVDSISDADLLALLT
jgi:hypothetical protein